MRLLLLIPLLAFTSTANATLISTDILDPAGTLVPGGSTVDTDSGLEWLDVTLTEAVSVDTVNGGFGPGVGWVNDGWRYATTAELCELFGALGDTIVNCPAPLGAGLGAGDALSGASATTFIQLLGGFLGNRVSGYFDDGGDPSIFGIGCIWNAPFVCGSLTAGASAFSNAILTSDLNGGVGSFLVREVPESSTALLLGLGLAGIATMRRRG